MNSAALKKWVDVADGRPITAHGLRAAFGTRAEEVTGFPHAVIEGVMGHQVGGQVERACRRTDVLEKRRDLMTACAVYCEPHVAAAGSAKAGPHVSLWAQ